VFRSFQIFTIYTFSLFQKGKEEGKESAVIGCLFGNYPALMLPLLTAEKDFKRTKRGPSGVGSSYRKAAHSKGPSRETIYARKT
jgi:hypothetical protein